MTRDDIISLREQADDWAEKHLQCQGEYHPDFHAVSDERFAALVRDRMIADGWRQCAQGQRTSQHCGMVEQERERLKRSIKHSLCSVSHTVQSRVYIDGEEVSSVSLPIDEVWNSAQANRARGNP